MLILSATPKLISSLPCVFLYTTSNLIFTHHWPQNPLFLAYISQNVKGMTVDFELLLWWCVLILLHLDSLLFESNNFSSGKEKSTLTLNLCCLQMNSTKFFHQKQSAIYPTGESTKKEIAW